MQPTEEDLAAAQVADPLDAQAAGVESIQQRTARQMDEMPGEVQAEPAVAEHARLDAARVGRRDDDDTIPVKHAHSLLDRLSRLLQVLERVPEDDRPPGALAQAADVHPVVVGVSVVALEPDRRPPSIPERIEQRPIPRPDIEDRARRRDPIEASGQRRSEAPQQGIAETREASSLGAVPATVGALELYLRRPRIGCGDTAGRTARPTW